MQLPDCNLIVDALLSLDCISCDDIPQASSISVLWQIPQFSLIGISEILASITSIEFFYSQAPTALRSSSQALNSSTQALGALLLVPLIYIVNAQAGSEWLPTDLNQGHLVWYFMLLAAIMAVDLVALWWVSRGYAYRTEADFRAVAALSNTGVTQPPGDNNNNKEGTQLEEQSAE